MNENRNKTAKAYLIFAVIAAVALSAAYIFAVLQYYEVSVHYFKAGALLPTVLHWAIFVSCALLLTSVFTLKKSALPKLQPKMSAYTTYMSAVCGFLLAIYGFIGAWYFVSDPSLRTKYEIWGLIAAPFAFIGAIYFIGSAVAKKEPGRAYSLFSCGAIVWSALMLIDAYFDMNTPLNSPPRIILQLSFIAMMLYLLFETRFLLGTAKPTAYFAFGCCALVLISVSASEHLMMTVMGFYTSYAEKASFAVLLAADLYILGRLISYIGAGKQNKSEDIAQPPLDENARI